MKPYSKLESNYHYLPNWLFGAKSRDEYPAGMTIYTAAVLAHLFRRSDKHSHSYPSPEQVAHGARMSTKQVGRELTRLQGLGLIVVTPNPDGGRKRYTIVKDIWKGGRYAVPDWLFGADADESPITLKLHDAAVLAHLLRRCDKNATCYPSAAAIAAGTLMSTRRVSAAVGCLQIAAVLEVINRFRSGVQVYRVATHRLVARPVRKEHNRTDMPGVRTHVQGVETNVPQVGTHVRTEVLHIKEDTILSSTQGSIIREEEESELATRSARDSALFSLKERIRSLEEEIISDKGDGFIDADIFDSIQDVVETTAQFLTTRIPAFKELSLERIQLEIEDAVEGCEVLGADTVTTALQAMCDRVFNVDDSKIQSPTAYLSGVLHRLQVSLQKKISARQRKREARAVRSKEKDLIASRLRVLEDPEELDAVRQRIREDIERKSMGDSDYSDEIRVLGGDFQYPDPNQVERVAAIRKHHRLFPDRETIVKMFKDLPKELFKTRYEEEAEVYDELYRGELLQFLREQGVPFVDQIEQEDFVYNCDDLLIGAALTHGPLKHARKPDGSTYQVELVPWELEERVRIVTARYREYDEHVAKIIAEKSVRNLSWFEEALGSEGCDGGFGETQPE